MTIVIPASALVLLIGAAGSGKSTFAEHHFAAHQIVSSDRLRLAVSDREDDQSATPDAFALARTLVRMRLGRGLVTVVDATNVQHRARRTLIALAARYARPAVAIVFDLPEELVLARNAARSRTVPVEVVRRQLQDLRGSAEKLKDEGFASVTRLLSLEEIGAVVLDRRCP
jgi:protein phosphatase